MGRTLVWNGGFGVFGKGLVSRHLSGFVPLLYRSVYRGLERGVYRPRFREEFGGWRRREHP